MIHGDAVKAYARPRFLRCEVSAVRTSTEKIMPMKPIE
jgi:hypothetical protein